MTQTPLLTNPILSSFALEQLEPLLYRGPSVANARRPVIFGGQLMGQMIVAAARQEPDKQVKSLHVIFARAGTVAQPVEIAIEPVQSGRAFASIDAVASQGERLLARALLLLDAGEPDVIRHQIPKLPVDGPEHSEPAPADKELGVEVRMVDSVDLMTTAVTGPAELHVWVRWHDVPEEYAMHQGLLAWFTDPFLIGAAMRPHEGIGLQQAHDTVSTGVITHTLTFHEQFRADEWLLISNRSLHAGAGRTYGEGHVFNESGGLVASFVQTNMIRAFRDDSGTRGKSAGAM